MTHLLPNPDFLEWLVASIAKARREIVLVNYLATLRKDGKGAVGRLVKALRAALKRKVEVRLVLEGTKLAENYAFYRALKDAGADAWMDTSATFIHEKAVMIDGKVLCIGSQNLTDSALTVHEELAIATDDAAAIGGFKKELERLTAQRCEIKGASREGVLLPATAVDALTRIKRSLATIPYLVYLILCREDKGRPRALRVDPAWIGELGLKKGAASDSRRLSEALLFLDKRLGLVSYDEKKDMVTRCVILSEAKVLHDSRRSFGGKGGPRGLRMTAQLLLPDAFWKYGWQARLSVEAIHLYFAGERERQESPFAPWWRKKRDEIAKSYGFQKQLVNRAQTELMRAGLLEVMYETASSVYQKYVRYSNYFRENPFYDFDARRSAIGLIAGQARPQVFALAQDMLQAVERDSDADALSALCRMAEAAGLPRARAVLRAIRDLAANSTRRTFEYAQELLTAGTT